MDKKGDRTHFFGRLSKGRTQYLHFRYNVGLFAIGYLNLKMHKMKTRPDLIIKQVSNLSVLKLLNFTVFRINLCCLCRQD